MKKDTYERARNSILYYITQFCTTHIYSDGEKSPGSHGFVNDMDHKKVQAGDLIMLGAAPQSKWSLSWLIEIKKGENHFYNQYLCESLEDGELIWWNNVSISFIERELLEENPQWRWTDRQFAFRSRWWRVCYKECDAYIVLPVNPIFGDDFKVTLGTRTRHSFDDYKPTKTFDDWRKVTKAMIKEYYNECVETRESLMESENAAK